jgi:hypothetical protein
MLQNYATIPLYMTHKNVTFVMREQVYKKDFSLPCLFLIQTSLIVRRVGQSVSDPVKRHLTGRWLRSRRPHLL